METNDMVGYLLLKDSFIVEKRRYWNTLCTLCGQEKTIRDDSLKSGKQISCGCYKKSQAFADKSRTNNPIEDLTGNIYGELTVLKLSDNRVGRKIMWTCVCTCGTILDVWSANLKNGNSKTCGGPAHRIETLKDVWQQTLIDLTGQIFNDWIVLRRDGNDQPTKWIVKCQTCGIEKSIAGNYLKTGASFCLDCKRRKRSLEGKMIGYWTIGEQSNRIRPDGHHCTTYFCTCICGVQRYVDESRLLNGKSLSCGCVKSAANEYITGLLLDNNIKFATEYKFNDLFGPNNGLLRFDFCIFDEFNNLSCLIEYQGMQHYVEGEFGRQQREVTDLMKKEYCRIHDLKLYEIRYDENIDDRIETILSELHVNTQHANPVPRLQ